MNIPKEEDANATRVYGIYFSLKLESPLFRMLGEELADETRERRKTGSTKEIL